VTTIHERNSAIVPVFAHEQSLLHPRRTYICLGVARGGTSAVAGVMQRLGIFMGDDLPNNYEDPRFGAGQPPARMRAAIEERNQAHDIWGWKFPAAANYAEGLYASLRNPYLVVVFRDLAATMKGHMRWHNREVALAAHEILVQQQKNWFLVERWRVPTLLVSYEKAMLEPSLFVQELAGHLGRDVPQGPDLDELVEFLTPGSYK
jgi:pimeloyl-ACP methyl ester carboxylesterase